MDSDCQSIEQPTSPPPPGRCRQEHTIAVPVLVLWADGDSALGANLLTGIHEEVPGVEVHVLEDCSHWIQQDRCAPAPRVTCLHR